MKLEVDEVGIANAPRVVRMPDVLGGLLGPVVRRGQVIKCAAVGAVIAAVIAADTCG